jgi:hypothetical protein
MKEIILTAKLDRYKPVNFNSIITGLIHPHALKNTECGQMFRAISCAGSILQIFLQMERRTGYDNCPPTCSFIRKPQKKKVSWDIQAKVEYVST